MSGQQPPRRRRIAGEAKPGETPQKPARRVVRKPVARPGVTPEPKAKQTPGPKAKQTPKPAAAPKVKATPVPKEKQAPSSRPSASTSRPATARPARPASAPESPARRDAVATGDAGSGRRKVVWDRALVGLALLAALSLAFAVAMGTLGVRTWNRTSGVESSQSAATQAASEAVTTVFTYRFDRLPQHLADSKKLMTPSFAKKFESISPTLDELAPQRKIQVKAETREAAAVPCVKDCDNDQATVLVFFDQARLADGATTPTVFANRISVEMRKVGGDWKVDDIQAL